MPDSISAFAWHYGDIIIKHMNMEKDGHVYFVIIGVLVCIFLGGVYLFHSGDNQRNADTEDEEIQEGADNVLGGEKPSTFYDNLSQEEKDDLFPGA